MHTVLCCVIYQLEGSSTNGTLISVLMQACLNPSPEHRPSCSDLLQFPYFDGVECTFSAEFWNAQVGVSAGPQVILHLWRTMSWQIEVELGCPCICAARDGRLHTLLSSTAIQYNAMLAMGHDICRLVIGNEKQSKGAFWLQTRPR